MSMSRRLLDRIKQQLNAKGIRYKAVAESMGVAESTVKRWFSSGNLSLAQLDELCALLNLDFEELSQPDRAGKVRESFSSVQDEFLAQNEKALVLFYLISSGISLEKIEARFQFSRRDIERALHQLDKNHLLELHPKGHIKLLAQIGTNWDPKGPLSRKYYGLIKNDFIMSDFTKARESHWFFSGPLTVGSQSIIEKKLEELAIEIKELYRLDRHEKKADSISLFCGMRPWQFPVIKKYQRGLV